MDIRIGKRTRGIVVVALALVVSACSQGDEAGRASQVVARVNDGEITIHQVNHLLQRTPNINEKNADAARKAILSGLVDQEVLVQEAHRQKLDRNPQVLQALQAARRKVLAGAVLEHLAGRTQKPTDAQIGEFYRKNPDLFAQRRIYQFSEVVLNRAPANWKDIEPEVGKVKTLKEAVNVLQAHGVAPRVSLNVVRPSEKLPLKLLSRFAQRKVKDLVIYPMKKAIVVGQINAIRDAPLTLDKARPLIERFLMKTDRSEAIKVASKRLKDSATVTYQGPFAALQQGSADAAASETRAAPATAVANDSADSGAPADPNAPINSEALTRGLKGLN